MKRYTPSPRALIHTIIYAITFPAVLAIAAILIDFSAGSRMLADQPRPAAPQPGWTYVYLPMIKRTARESAPVASTHPATLVDYEFVPKTMAIMTGDTIVWTQEGEAPHNVTASDGSWASAQSMAKGETYAHTFTQAGTFSFYCTFHGTPDGQYMAGTVVVTQRPEATPEPTSEPLPTRTPVVVPTSPPPPAGSKPVSAQDFVFAPKTIVITRGATVNWTMDGVMPHTVTASDNSFDSGVLNNGQSYSRTFSEAGTFSYYCKLHGTSNGSGMAGTVIVNEPGAAPQPTPTNAPPQPTSTPAPPPPPPPAGTKAVDAANFAFTPKTISITKGDTIRWAMADAFPHTVTATNGSFDSGTLNQGQTYSRTFNQAGTFSYYCTLHGTSNGSGMAGTVIVNEPGATPQPTPTNAPPQPTSTPAPPPPPPPAGTKAVSAANFVFTPKTISITRGQTVRWTMSDAFPHTVTATNGSFDSGILNNGQGYSRTFNQAGTFSYYCTLHGTAGGSGMAGTVIVNEPGAAPQPTPTNAPPQPTSTPAPPPPPPPAGTKAVSAANFAFTPQNIVITKGQSVRWTMADAFLHTVTATDGSFDSGTLNQGQTYSRTYNTVGTFAYYCKLHGTAAGTGMAGNVIVTDAGAPPPPTPTPLPSPTPIPPPPPPSAGTYNVQAANNAFTPRSLTIIVGETVRWLWADDKPHTVTANTGSWSSGTLNPGQQYTRTFAQAGTFSYYCQLHGGSDGSGMAGTITVLPAGSPPPPPQPTPPPPPAASLKLQGAFIAGPAGANSSGKALYEARNGSHSLMLELKDGPANATIIIYADGVSLGTTTLDGKGQVRFTLDSTAGDAFAPLSAGVRIELKTGSGGVVASAMMQ